MKPKSKKPSPPARTKATDEPLELSNTTAKPAPPKPKLELTVKTNDAFPLVQLYYDYRNARNAGKELHISDIDPDIVAGITARGVLNPLNIRLISKDEREARKIPAQFTHIPWAGNSRRCVALHLGHLTVPVRDYGQISTALAAELADIDNIQRADIKPTERARCMARMVKEHGWKWYDDKDPANSIGHKFNMGKSNAFAMMRLANAPVLIAEAVDAGQLTKSVAGLLLTIFDAESQKIATAQAILHHWTDADAARIIGEKYKTQLKGAPWKWENEEDKDLVPKVGSCKGCPFRSGNQADFIDGRGDICGKPSCWREKSQAQFAITAKTHQRAGGRVMSTREAIDAGLTSHYTSLSPNYVPITEPFTTGTFTTRGKPLSAFIQPAPDVLILAITNDGTARHYWLLSRSKAIAMLTNAGHIEHQKPAPKDDTAARSKEGIRRNQRILDSIAHNAIAAIGGAGRIRQDFRLAVRLILANASETTIKALPGLLDLPLKLTADAAEARASLDLQLRTTETPEKWLAALIMQTSVYHSGLLYAHQFAADAKLLAAALGLDLEKTLKTAHANDQAHGAAGGGNQPQTH